MKSQIKNNITFQTWNEAQYCSRVLLNFNGKYSNKVNKAIEDLGWRIWKKEAKEDGTVSIRLSNDVRDTVTYALTESSLSVVEMYRDKYADAYFELFQ
tara:strand:+ start:177 stop:470 length:294 start_codon:yes stop_codon:yes gene_type:complete